MKKIIFTVGVLICFNANIGVAQERATDSTARIPRGDHGRNPRERNGMRDNMKNREIDSNETKANERMLFAKKNEYLKRKLRLTAEESKKFTPLYLEYTTKLNELKSKSRAQIAQLKLDSADLVNKAFLKLVDNELTLKQQELDLLKKYHEKFKVAIAPLKVAKLYVLEEKYYEDKIRRANESEDRHGL